MSRTLDQDMLWIQSVIHQDLSAARKGLSSGQIQVVLEMNQGVLKRIRITTERVANPTPSANQIPSFG
jgi:hypothetical protein